MSRSIVALTLVAACWTSSGTKVAAPESPTPAPAPAPPPEPDAAAAPPKVAVAAPIEDPITVGRRVYNAKGCVKCHTLDGKPNVGPSWKGIWDTDVKMAMGDVVHVDAAYIRRSILHPQADRVASFPPAMPSFEGQLTEQEIAGVIALIQSL